MSFSNMTTTITRFMLIACFVSFFLLNLHQCYPNPSPPATTASTNTAILPKPTQDFDFDLLKKIVVQELNKKDKDDGDEIADELEAIRQAKEKVRQAKDRAKERARKSREKAKEHKDRDDDDNNNNNDDDNSSSDTNNISSSSSKSTSKQYKHHESSNSDDDNNDDKEGGDKKPSSHNNSKDDADNSSSKAGTATTPTNTVVTTIIVVSTETPKTIYTGSGSSSDSAKQKSDTSKNHQVSDPNDGSSSKSDNGSTGSSSSDDSQISHDTAVMLRDQLAYRKLVTALSIVGGIAGIALITGGLVFTRMRMRKRKRKQEDLEVATTNNDEDNNRGLQSPPSPPPPTPPHSTSSYPQYNARFSNDGGDTVIGFSQDPFSDPADLSNSKNMIQSLDQRMSLQPTAPPSLPVNLEPPRRYTDYRQNQTLSMLSQTTATALPSAPSAKELDALHYDNPFDDEGFDITEENEDELQRLGQPHHRHHPSVAISITASSIVTDQDALLPSLSLSSHLTNAGGSSSSSLTTTSSRPSYLQRQQDLQKSQESFSSSANLPPPPAYTPSAPPSAPPLYALPTSRLALEAERQQLQQQQEEEGSRRHSISSCSMTSISRPLSLRRGSGSLALISFK
ncbi:hypothetical protein MAM1_0289d09288 [Mucor ambiguus]|uniref:Uncharacterized protein n=1 Tax=Mucor ambiguus TaxID=91626 RepID=A0A0C9MGE2_9FUNG|nr:hypothetical protein MAM1_0289d09288 [Mucor ambiguus]